MGGGVYFGGRGVAAEEGYKILARGTKEEMDSRKKH